MAKCREGRLDYGSIASLFIRPLSLILLDETMGNLIIDSVVPSIYSGAIIGSAKMVEVSIALLVVPLLVVVAIVMCVIFLYRPAKIAVSKRLEIKKTYWDQADSTKPALISKRALATHTHSSFGDVLKRLLAATKRALRVSYMYLQAIVVRYSINGHEMRLELNRSRLNTWQTINIPPYVQGYHNDRNVTNFLMIDDHVPIGSSKSRERSRKRGFRPPVEIANMMPSTHLKEFYLNDKRMKSEIYVEPLVISQTSSHLEINKESKLKASIIFEFFEASSQILSHLSASLCSHYPFISVIDLLKEFENIWEVFYPGGVMMSETERMESRELFNIWKGKQKLLYEENSVDGDLVVVQKVSVELFEWWFLNEFSEMIKNKKTDRLIDHMLYTRQRIKGPDIADSKPSSPYYKTTTKPPSARTIQQPSGNDSVKALESLTPSQFFAFSSFTEESKL